MPTKEQLSEELNEMFDVEVDWSKMNKDDLQLLLELAKEGALIEPLIKHQVKEHGKNTWEDKVDEWYPGKYAGGVL